MYLLILYVFYMSFIPHEVDSMFARELGLQEKCILTTQINQPYFENVDFYEVDTGCVIIHPSEKIPYRFAVDTGDNLYRLFNTDTCEYNLIISKYPVVITQYNVHQYGQFFLEVTKLYMQWSAGYYFLKGTEDFVSLNNSLASSSGYRTNHELNRDSVLSEIHKICDTLNYDEIIFYRGRHAFVIDYYVWMECNGDLKYYQLEIGNNGDCHILQDTIIARNLGYHIYYFR